MRRLILCLAASAVLAASALPSKKEVAAARDVVSELMSDAVAEQKAGRLTAAQVAEKALELAGRAETEAAKLLLLQGAVMGFARGGEPARAAEAMQRMKVEIKDVTPEYEADVLARAVKTVPAKSGSRLYEMLDDAKRLVRFRKEAAAIEKKLAKTDAPELRMQLAERLAALGEWKRALEMFAKMDGDISRAAKFERGELTAMTASEVADIWWAQKGMKDSAGFTVFQRHAGEWYRKALADGSLKGLKRDLAQKRLAGMGHGERGTGNGERGTGNGTSETGGPRALEANENAPRDGGDAVAVQNGERPKDLVFKLDSKTNLEMVGIPAGTFTMGWEDWDRQYFRSQLNKPHEVTITRPFWASKTPVTVGALRVLGVGKWEVETYKNFLDGSGFRLENFDSLCVRLNKVSIDDMFRVLNKRIRNSPKGYVFRLPTAAEWEYILKCGGEDPVFGSNELCGNQDSFRKVDVLTDGVKAAIQKLRPDITVMDHKRMLDCSAHVPPQLWRANSWGLYSVNCDSGDIVLDTIDLDSINLSDDRNVIPFLKGGLPTGRDPLLVFAGKNASRIRRGAKYFPEYWGVAIRAGNVHIVLGPDLLAEQAKKR